MYTLNIYLTILYVKYTLIKVKLKKKNQKTDELKMLIKSIW